MVAVLLRRGFEIGDCLTLDFALAFAAFFLTFFARSPGAGLGKGTAVVSRSISLGELEDTALRLWSKTASGSF